MRRAVVACTFLLLLLGAGPATAADSSDNDRVVVVGPVTVPRGEVAHDVVVGDGDVVVSGQVSGDLVVAKGTVKISGTVKGDVFAISDRITIDPGARVGGDVSYVNEKPAVASGAQVSGKVKRVNVDKIAGPVGFAAGIGAWLAISISALLLGLLALWLAPRAALAAQETAETRKGRSFAWGLALFFGIPIVAVILLVTLLGLPLGLLMLLALLPLYALGYTTSAWALGRRLLGADRGRILAFIAGTVILRLVALIPIAGGLVWFLATVFGLGVLVVAAGRGPRDSGAAVAAPR
ncbi:MAG: polymer-forming cytoskeletal protein [Actinomycetota bacterium]|nr:polymer-forming cytoskeletal protein [Actinomycetota bacterium]